MYLNRLFGHRLCSKSKDVINQKTRVLIGTERFEIMLDVNRYNKEEIVVKAQPTVVIIEGKQEREAKGGILHRRFVKKFRLPTGCVLNQMTSKLGPEGILTISAPLSVFEHLICETINIVVESGDILPTEKAPKTRAETVDDYCKKYPKVKPRRK